MPPQNQSMGQPNQLPTIQSLQSYITELTTYINENNQIYNKNLHTISEFYHQQV